MDLLGETVDRVEVLLVLQLCPTVTLRSSSARSLRVCINLPLGYYCWFQHGDPLEHARKHHQMERLVDLHPKRGSAAGLHFFTNSILCSAGSGPSTFASFLNFDAAHDYAYGPFQTR